MFIKISSVGPNSEVFSRSIKKNPASPARIISVRKGYCVGGFYSPSTYLLQFYDGNDAASFSKDNVDYLDKNKFYSAACAANCLELLKGLDDTNEQSFFVEVDALKAAPETQARLERFFVDKFCHKIHVNQYRSFNGVFKLSLSCTGTSPQLVDFLELLFFYLAVENEEDPFTTEELAVKYFKKVAELDMPYHFRYILKNELVRESSSRFNAIKQYINKSEKWDFNFCRHSNIESRINFIGNYVDGQDVVDIGCGEGRYARRFAKNYSSYYGIDPNVNVLEQAEQRSTRDDNIFRTELKPEIVLDDSTIIVSEVVEHLGTTVGDHTGFWKPIAELKPKRVIVTTPNADFNKHYNIEVRHPDHKQEFTEVEFHDYCDLVEQELDMIYNVFPVGDCVDGSPTTFGAIYERR